ncbi:hypothetical protein NDA13_000172 [Ustilago tritici]|nr:hypothetical protein NDA13_000172 [Ustilago tritici]
MGYSGPLRHNTRLSVPNLRMGQDNELHLRQEIEARLLEGRLRPVQDPARSNLICSPVGVVPKPHSSKRRTIYHLSHPRRPGSRLPSINTGIHPSFVRIWYENLNVIINFIRQNPGAHLWKADLEDAFRHIIVADSDARLMGIHFDGSYYQECALAFGGRSSPFLFNLFAEFLHWLTFTLNSVSPAPHTHSGVSHYLDDFYGASELGAHPARRRVSLLELQQVAGHLQFVTRVVPHGRAFLRRLYDVIKAPFSRHLNKGACDELSWWTSTLAAWDGISLLQPSPLVIEHLWTDASKRSNLSEPAAFLLWNGLAASTRSRSSTTCNDFISFTSDTLRLLHTLPASTDALIKWVSQFHRASKPYQTIKCNLAILKSLHIDLGQPTTAFDAARLARALMFRAAFCLAFACFLRSGELTWETPSSRPVLTVGSVGFASDGTFATIFLPSSKTDPFGAGVTLTAPSVPHRTCAVKALKTICKGCSPPTLLFTLEQDLPFAQHSFLDTLSRCLTACGISPNGYSGHSFRRGAATWVAANGADDATIQGLGRWCSDCFRQYVDKPAAVLYANADQPLDLSTPAWRDL